MKEKAKRLNGFGPQIPGITLALAVLLCSAGTRDVFAATFTVTNTNNSGAGSLRQAVLDSNAAAGSDDIVFDSSFNTPQTITLASVITLNPALGDAVTITGPGANILTVSGNNAVRIFQISSGDAASLSGMTLKMAVTGAIDNDGNLTVTNCVFSTNTAGNGGAIANSLFLTVTGCTFTGNTATSSSATGLGGGAIYSNTTPGMVLISGSTFTGNMEVGGSSGGGAIRNRGGTIDITNSTFTNNSAVDGGGAIQNSAEMSIAGCIFTGNTTASATSDGGAINNSGDGALTMTNSVVMGNSTANRGGGIYHQTNATSGASLSITGSTISNNTANSDSNTSGDGGGLYLTGTGSVTITGSTINGNTSNAGATGSAGDGGGIDVSTPLTLTNSTVSGNMAARNGGGIYATGVSTAVVNITSATIVNNTAAADGGGLVRGSTSNPVNFRNTIVANNTDDGTAPDVFGLVESQGYNLIENTTGATINGDTATNITGRDPNLGPLQDNGGNTHTHALAAGSPAVDRGSSFGSITDQRGKPRPFNNAAIPNATSGDGADIGAFEVQLPVVTGFLSRKVHGSSGAFDIDLLSTPVVTECRAGGAGGNYQVVVTFQNPVSVSGISVMSIDGMASGTFTAAGAVVTVDLSAVANVQTLGITLINVNDGTIAGDVFIPLGVLVGDTTGNGAVSASDIGQVKGQSGQAVIGANFRADVTANGGSINASDIGLVKSRSGTQLP